jgi:hypothetical protein
LALQLSAWERLISYNFAVAKPYERCWLLLPRNATTMLDFSPHGIPGDDAMLKAVADAYAELPGTGLLLRLIAEARHSPLSRQRIMVEPERLSGFCAAG